MVNHNNNDKGWFSHSVGSCGVMSGEFAASIKDRDVCPQAFLLTALLLIDWDWHKTHTHWNSGEVCFKGARYFEVVVLIQLLWPTVWIQSHFKYVKRPLYYFSAFKKFQVICKQTLTPKPYTLHYWQSICLFKVARHKKTQNCWWSDESGHDWGKSDH